MQVINLQPCPLTENLHRRVSHMEIGGMIWLEKSNGTDETPTWTQHARNLVDRLPRCLQVLEDLHREDYVESLILGADPVRIR